MNNTLIFLRHGETKKDKSVPVAEWVLTEEGQKATADLINTGVFDDVDIIISSGETKAYQTVEPLAKNLGKEITKIPELNEIGRGEGETMTTEEYRKMKVKIFKDLDFTDHGWETANHALNRFKEAVEKINAQYEDKNIILAAHGTVMTLYFAFIQDKMDKLMERWKGLGFCDYGIVENKKVIKDIV